MSHPAISVECLGKSYRIGRAAQRAKRGGAGSWSALASALRGLRREGDETLWALRNISFEVQPGEVLGVIGRNGAGKSTLLKILSRITDPTEGRAIIRGRVNSLLEVGTGFHAELTGRENIYMNAAMHGMRRVEINRNLDEIVAFAEMEKFIDTPVKRYSSGMYTRLAFAVAAHLEPEILIVDEVLAVGDAEFQKKCIGKMSEVARGGRTVLYVSHNMGSVQQMCSRGILLDHGGVVLDGSAAEVTMRYLRAGLDHEGGRTWRDESHAPGNETVRLRAIRILDADGRPANVPTVRDVVLLEAEYRIFRSCPLDAYFYFFNQTGACVMVSIDNRNSPWGDNPRPPGIYRSVCRIPGDFLNEGEYICSFYVAQKVDKAIMHLEARDVISFAVADSVDPAGVRGNYNRTWPASVVRPRLEWTVTKLD